MANFWVHAGLLNVDGQKMSKSLGNFTPLSQVLDRYPAAVVRYLFLQTGYRKTSNFTAESIDAAGKGLRGLYADLDSLRASAKTDGAMKADGAAAAPTQAAVPEEFNAFLDDDLNTAGAVGWLQTYVKNALKERTASPASVVAIAEQSLERFGLPRDAESAGVAATSSPVKLNKAARMELSIIAGERESSDVELVEKVVAVRESARKSKDWAKSDRLRDALARAGIAVKDTPSGAQWSFDGRS
jgi:cysteinyl-tRNA synthetase